MSNKPLHIVSFDNPFPANYGGVIDVFYKVKALHNLGYEIYLHCFYQERATVAPELKALTKEVYLYPKVRRISFLFSSIPFSVITRYSKALEANIKAVNAPILFEGLQTTMLLRTWKGSHTTFLRLHNIESNFYAGIATSETNWFKKILYYLERNKYRKYEQDLQHFKQVFTLSPYEKKIVTKLTSAVSYVPVFHGNETVAPLSGKGAFCLYHGDLRLPDNKKVASFLIRIFKKLPAYTLVIASSAGKDFVEKQLKGTDTIRFEWIKEESQLNSLLAQAHVNVLWSFQKSGTKLKVINALFKSRFCLINGNMVDDAALLQLCEVANTENAVITQIERLFTLEYTQYETRAAVLQATMDDHKNAQLMVGLMEYPVA
jgi:hypothetical protein